MWEVSFIRSGGQTGVDRAALDFALQQGVPCGGWCPEGRLDENGVIPSHYPVIELEGAGFDKRTVANVDDSGATLILCYGFPTGGTLKTVEACKVSGKRYLIIDGKRLPAITGAKAARNWLKTLKGVKDLNVAGPRASEWAGGYAYAMTLLAEMIGGAGSA